MEEFKELLPFLIPIVIAEFALFGYTFLYFLLGKEDA